MEAARRHMVTQSKGENGKKRKNSVERYLYQFMRGHGQTATKAYKDGWDRIFGAKEADKPPRAYSHPTADDIRKLVGPLLGSLLPDGELVGVAMRGLGGKANPSHVHDMIRTMRAELREDRR